MGLSLSLSVVGLCRRQCCQCWSLSLVVVVAILAHCQLVLEENEISAECRAASAVSVF